MLIWMILLETFCQVPGFPAAPGSGVVPRNSLFVAHQGDVSAPEDVPAAVQSFVRDLVLAALPPQFEDDDDWGSEKRIQSGLDIDWDDGRLETRRRWKTVNHGFWIRASGRLTNPEQTMTLKISRRNGEEAGEQWYRIRLLARVDVSGTQQQWNHGVMFWSVTADAEADIQLDVETRVRTGTVTEGSATVLRIDPVITFATLRLNSFRLRRLSHLRGRVAGEFGEQFEELVRMFVEKQNKKLPQRINKSIRKQQDHLQIPVDPGSLFDWFESEDSGSSETSDQPSAGEKAKP